eukprot:gene5592-biopygen10920
MDRTVVGGGGKGVAQVARRRLAAGRRPFTWSTTSCAAVQHLVGAFSPPWGPSILTRGATPPLTTSAPVVAAQQCGGVAEGARRARVATRAADRADHDVPGELGGARCAWGNRPAVAEQPACRPRHPHP